MDTEVRTADSEHLGPRVPLAHNDNRRVGQVHLVVAPHQGAEPRPVCRNLEVQPNRVALKHLKQGSTSRRSARRKCATSVRTGSVGSIGERTCFISAAAKQSCGSLRFR